MKRFLLLALMLMLVACTSSVDTLNGSWQGNAEATFAANQSPEYQSKIATEAGKKLLSVMLDASKMSIDTEKKQITLSFAGFEQKKAFSIVSEDGKAINIDMEGQKGTLVVEDDNTLRVENLTDNKGTTIVVFKRITK